MPIPGWADGRLGSVETWQGYLNKSLLSRPSPNATTLFTNKFGSDAPWVFDSAHEELISRFIQNVEAQAKQEAKTKPGTSQAFIRANIILHAMREPRDKGGLGLRYADHTEPEADVNQALDRGFARCTEFQALYYVIALRMGLKAYPIDIPQVDEHDVLSPHAAVMIRDEAYGAVYFADMQIIDVQRSSPYNKYYVGTEADLFATYLYNRSMVQDGASMKMSASPTAP
ncbi:MAG: hypothetical protein WC690_09945, partial [bacterium]